MRSLDALVRSVQSPDARERDSAALELMDLGDERAVPALLAAIAEPRNVNHRGTLVHALSAFDPQPHLERLVELALAGNSEVSVAALAILREADRSPEPAARMRAALEWLSASPPQQAHQDEAREFLRDLLGDS